MIWLRYGVFALLVYAIALLMTFPAQRAYTLWGQVLEPVQLAELSGSLWHGRAKAVQWRGEGVRDVVWSLRLAELLLGRLAVAVEFANEAGTSQAVIGRSWGGEVFVRDAHVQLPARMLGSWMPMRELELSGHFKVRLDGLGWDNGRLRPGRGEIVWQNAALLVPVQVRLGELVAQLEPDNEGLKAQLSDRGGPLSAQGVLNLQPDGRYEFRGSFRAREADSPLQQGLQFLGRPGSDGRIQIRRSGQVTWPGLG